MREEEGPRRSSSVLPFRLVKNLKWTSNPWQQSRISMAANRWQNKVSAFFLGPSAEFSLAFVSCAGPEKKHGIESYEG
jgi:hypothetical protein